ncbi:D-cysteine desulfhydrase family protein [Sediminispirochaeta bajacaliforniensis]|uniref:D-cysteine desulfhydrase family protein n=1 Tax=Sediminispirochaeta bajacaliforniensis TaxID=148 RepID=UPI00047683DC|nr:D-cysteine desulfhydrase family protein [Sediminispirochaeta bajacaliforniensis]
MNTFDGLFNSLSRLDIGFYPTPLQKLENLSKMLGVEIYFKRDDLAGYNAFCGNKIRKLEFLLADALSKKSEVVITYGALQSNHAMQTAAVCRRYGLKPVLFLLDHFDESSSSNINGNYLLDRLLGAECHIVRLSDYTNITEAKQGRNKEADEYKEGLKSKAITYYDIPGGGATPIGSVGFVRGIMELNEQQMGRKAFDSLFCAVGSGGTMAGLAVGKKALGLETKLVGFTVGETDDDFSNRIINLANQTAFLLGIEQSCKPTDISIDKRYCGEAYERPSEISTQAIKLLAQHEGLFIDPVYTAKAVAGMIDYIEKGIIKKGSKVCFWHTGGCAALFGDKRLVGDIFN